MEPQFKVRMVGYEWCHQIWSNLETYFVSQTKARVKQLKIQLRATKKSTTIHQYLLEIKKIVDTLAAIGSPLDIAEHIDAIFDGLPEDYDPFTTSVLTRTDEYTVEQIEALPMAQEEQLEKHKRNDSTPLQANMTQSNFQTRKQTTNERGVFNHNGTNGRSYQRGRGRGRSNQNFGRGNKQQCQVCGKIGHIAFYCWHRYDQQFAEPNFNNNTNSTNSGTSQQMQAMFVGSQTMPYDDQWYPDSGATNHLTPDLNNLGSRTTTIGQDKIHMGNGQAIGINHTGTSMFHTRMSPKVFILKDLLHVPHITKNLLSVSKLCRDNEVYLEFHINHCFVKSQDSKEILLQGNLKNGLYVFDAVKFLKPDANSAAYVPTVSTILNVQRYEKSYVVWHNRLSHASRKIVEAVMKTCNIPLTVHNNKDFSVCKSCCIGKSHALPFSDSNNLYNAPLELIYSDVWGPSHYVSREGFRYYVHFTDAYSKCTWVYLMHNKYETAHHFTHFKTMAENQFGRKIKMFQSDGRKEFTYLTKFFNANGIIHRLSCSHTHPQNGTTERKHSHIIEIGIFIWSPS
uniref:Retrovirus-related Pol polyprotein from transposon TNT 1-94 n=1 Tax=Cajanus cajan TaxID=3821 RepID=A0A151RSA4_CAJCA|nr:Retrovirus-related Pol polyprotein from transposon TNT 1-94 [Cajanus cajan]